MKKERLHSRLSSYRYEFLLMALLMLIFNKIFFPDNAIYLQYVWPFNMVLISIASFGIFIDQSYRMRAIRNIMSTISVLMPIGFLIFLQTNWFIHVLTIFFLIYYIFIFREVMVQITRSKEVRLNVIIGSFCGYMLLSMIALFSYLIIELNWPKSFHGISYNNVSAVYNEMSYFSFITLTSIGFGDMYPITDMSRLTTAFFGMIGQFYMVAVVGIIISKFSSKN